MRKANLFFLCMLAGIAACGLAENRPPDKPLPDSISASTSWQPLSDSGAAVYVAFRYNAAGNDSIKWGNADFSRIENLKSLTGGRYYQYPPLLSWQNEHFISLMTYADGPFSEHLFLPVDSAASPRFFASEIEYSDTTFNFVLTLDSVSETGNKRLLGWKISALQSNESLSFSAEMPAGCTHYPWHGEIKRSGEKLIICDCDGKTAMEVAIRQFLAEDAAED